MKRTAAHVFSTIVAIYYPFCTASVRPTLPPSEVHMAELWQRPDDLASRDLFYGREDGKTRQTPRPPTPSCSESRRGRILE